jgi:hypothetical protein
LSRARFIFGNRSKQDASWGACGHPCLLLANALLAE